MSKRTQPTDPAIRRAIFDAGYWRPDLVRIARDAGCSSTTVSNALGRPDYVTPETLGRVLRVIGASGKGGAT